jgi:hypothetical protein
MLMRRGHFVRIYPAKKYAVNGSHNIIKGCVRRRIRDVRRRCAWFLLNVGEQPGLNRGGRAQTSGEQPTE